MAVQHVTPINLPGAAGRKDEGRGNQRVGILVPDSTLRMWVEHTQHPVMAGQIGKIPGYGSVALSKQFRAIDQGDIVKLKPTYPPRLNDPEKTGFVQVVVTNEPSVTGGPTVQGAEGVDGKLVGPGGWVHVVVIQSGAVPATSGPHDATGVTWLLPGGRVQV